MRTSQCLKGHCYTKCLTRCVSVRVPSITVLCDNQQALELFQNGKPVTSNALGSFIDKQLMSFYNQQKLLVHASHTVQFLSVVML